MRATDCVVQAARERQCDEGYLGPGPPSLERPPEGAATSWEQCRSSGPLRCLSLGQAGRRLAAQPRPTCRFGLERRPSREPLLDSSRGAFARKRQLCGTRGRGPGYPAASASVGASWACSSRVWWPGARPHRPARSRARCSSASSEWCPKTCKALELRRWGAGHCRSIIKFHS